MNHDGRMATALDWTDSTPARASEDFEQGERIAEAVSVLRDEILGAPRHDETLVEYVERGRRALATAKEVVLHDEVFEAATIASAPEAPTTDPIITSYFSVLQEIATAVRTPLADDESTEPSGASPA